MSIERNYELLSRISQGGSAEVYEANALGEDGFSRKVAIKILLPEVRTDDAFLRSFVDEARIASQLHHAGIVSAIDAGLLDGRPFIAMELIAGADCRKLERLARKSRTPVRPEIALAIAVEVAHALDYAHRAVDGEGRPMGIIHRDVSAENVIVSWEGDVKLTDFGIARALQRVESTRIGETKGKPDYMAPEQALGGDVDGRADLFALGCVLHRLLAGKSARVKDSQALAIEPSLPSDVRAVIDRATRLARADRYPTGADFAADAGAALVKRLNVDARTTLKRWLAPFNTPAKKEPDKGWGGLLEFDLGQSDAGHSVGRGTRVVRATSVLAAPLERDQTEPPRPPAPSPPQPPRSEPELTSAELEYSPSAEVHKTELLQWQNETIDEYDSETAEDNEVADEPGEMEQVEAEGRTVAIGSVARRIRGLRATVVRGPDAGRSAVSNSGVLSVGTAPGNTLRLSDQAVSPYHLELTWADERIRVEDFGSAVGTWLAGLRLLNSTVLIGSQLTLHNTTIEIGESGSTLGLGYHPRTRLGALLGASPKMRAVIAELEEAASETTGLLLVGEIGTGKALAARTVHDIGPQRDHSFETFDVAATSPAALDRELFGEDAGSGAIHRAAGGVLYIAGVDAFPARAQKRLSDALEQVTLQRAGSRRAAPSAFRLIASARQDLRPAVNAGKFHAGLYVRLSGRVIRIPPLRERPEDLLLLIEHFLGDLRRLRKKLFPDSTIQSFRARDWPENVRELRAVVRNVIDGPARPIGAP